MVKNGNSIVMIVTLDYNVRRKMGILKTDFLDNIREHFSVADDKVDLKKKFFGYKYLPSRKYCITKTGMFEIGMTYDIITYLKSTGIQFKVVFTQAFKDAFNASYYFHKEPLAEIVDPPNYQERAYQTDSIHVGLKLGNGVFLLKTAAGKTYIMCKLVQTIRSRKDVKTLIIVPSVQLVEQTYADFLEMGVDRKIISKWSGTNELNVSSEIIIAYAGILKETPENILLLNSFNLVLYDEVHGLRKQNKINRIFNHFKTRNIFGFTGSMPPDLIDEWNIKGKVGPIIYTVDRDTMVTENYIADAEVTIVNISYITAPSYQYRKIEEYKADETDDQRKSRIEQIMYNYNLELDFIASNHFRNTLIYGLVEKLEKNILIMVDRINHGEILLEFLSKLKNRKVVFIQGDTEIDAREEIRIEMEKSDNVVCIAMAKIFSTGINIKNLHYVMFAASTKSKVTIVQSIGRGVRLHENKNKLIVFDLADDLKYNNRHLIRRKEIYDEEGFKTKTIQVQERVR